MAGRPLSAHSSMPFWTVHASIRRSHRRSRRPPTPPSPTATTRPAATSTPILRTVATPTPKADAVLLPDPTATSTATAKPAAGEWTTFSDANVGNQLTVISNTIWIATEGGALAWSKGSITPVKFTAVDGLDGNRLTAVVNCPLPELGVMFGSERGLQIVDPRAGGWKHLNSDNSDLSHDDVSALICDAKNQFVVVGFTRHGIDIFDAAEQEWRHLDRNSGLASNDVNHLAVVGDREAIWVVSNDGVTVAAGQDSTFYNADNSPLADNRIGAIVADPSGVVWLGGEGALYRVDGETWTVFGAETVNGEPFPAKLITGLAAAPDGTLWLGSVDAEICHFSPEERRCLQRFSSQDGMAAGPLTNLTLDSTGQVYYTTAGNGYSRYDGEQWRSFVKTDEMVRGNQVKALAVDDTGAQWVATELGVQRFTKPDKPGELFDAENSGLAVADVRVLVPGAEGGLWVGGQGASFFDGDTWQTLTISDGLAGAIVQAITVDGQQRTWFGTDGGLSVWNGAVFFNITKDRGLPSDNITALVADGNAVWIGTQGGGLYRFENSQLQIFNQENVGLPSDTITALTLTGDGALLIGTDRGLAQFKDGSVSLIAEAPALLISALAAQGKEIWAGTADSGVFHFDGAAWRQLTGADGLPSDRIAAILATDKATWIGGQDGGLARYNP